MAINRTGHIGSNAPRPSQTYTTEIDHPKFETRNGIFSATIVDNSDPDYNGSMWVQITGSYNSSSTQTQEERHANFTKIRPIQQSGGTISGQNFSQQFGSSNTPPTIGTEVLVGFSGGQEGFLLGSMIPASRNAAVPGISASPLDDEPDVIAPSLDHSVVEEQSGNTRVRDPIANTIAGQGIALDPIRGIGSEGARRESPSRVTGQRTPGGHSFVMDDGTESFKEGANYTPDPNRQEGTNKLIRLRSGGGSQLLLNDEAGIVYIMSGTGNSWIQMDSDGNIDIYAAKNISYHSEDSINFYAADAFNIEADIVNIKARGDNLNLEAASADINLYATKNANITADLNINEKSGGDIKLTSDGNIHLNGPTADTAEKPVPEPMPVNRGVKESINGRVPEHEPYGGHQVNSLYLAAQARSSMTPDTKDLSVG
jgi:hypothetical protein